MLQVAFCYRPMASVRERAPVRAIGAAAHEGSRLPCVLTRMSAPDQPMRLCAGAGRAGCVNTDSRHARGWTGVCAVPGAAARRTEPSPGTPACGRPPPGLAWHADDALRVRDVSNGERTGSANRSLRTMRVCQRCCSIGLNMLKQPRTTSFRHCRTGLGTFDRLLQERPRVLRWMAGSFRVASLLT